MSTAGEENNNIPGEYLESQQVTANMRWRRQRLALYRRVWAVAWTLILAFLVEAWIAAWFSPRNYIYRLETRNTDSMTEEEVIRLAAVKPKTNYFRVPLQEIATRIKSQDPRVDNVIVERGAMGTLILTVNERKAVCRLGTSEPPMYLDEKGYLFTRPIPTPNLVPIVTAIEAPTEKKMGEKLTEAYVVPVLKAVVALPAKTNKGFLIEAASLKVDEKSGATYELSNGIIIEYGTLTYPEQKAEVIKNLIDNAIEAGNAPENILSLNVTGVDNKMLRGSYTPRTPTGGTN